MGAIRLITVLARDDVANAVAGLLHVVARSAVTDTPTVWPIFIEKTSRYGDFGSVGYADAPHLAPLAERQKWPVW